MSELADKQIFTKDVWGNYHCRLTLREYFAAAALQGLLAGPFGEFSEGDAVMADCSSRCAVLCADALIAELGKPKQ